MNLRARISRQFKLGLVVVGVLLALLVWASARLVVSETESRDIIAEDLVWLASQTQYEAVRMADALSNYRLGGVTLAQLQLRHDILSSRIATLEEGPPGQQVQLLGYADHVAALHVAVDGVGQRLPGLAQWDVGTITTMRNRVLPVAQSLRDLANVALLDRRERDGVWRDHRRRTLFEVLATLSATMIAGVLLAAVYVRDHRSMANAQTALERERQVSRLHRTFISVVSHQFRTPIAIIDASAQRMIRRGPNMPHEEVARRAEKIRNACLRLTRLIESTLNAARLEEGEISFTPRACNPGHLLRAVCDGQPEMDQNRITLDVSGLPQWIEADPVLLEQAVQNLISNALKYSPAGSPVEITGALDSGGIVFTIADHGVGIPADEMGQLFQRFFRARTAEGIPGTGIGLSFVTQVMELHGGRVDVSSIEGQGSTFTVRFPHRRPSLQEDTPVAALEAQV